MPAPATTQMGPETIIVDAYLTICDEQAARQAFELTTTATVLDLRPRSAGLVPHHTFRTEAPPAHSPGRA
ncbi:hypothetical protein ACGFNP_43645 [Nonomuraea sp. NPDC049269]|uniref:hypothetical protein n=1 Tax=Nonomuraea sp. NPDC049269 TaxID=3364349 RepID=UPI0037154F1E